MKAKLRQANKLLQLAELREGLAQREVAAAAAVLSDRAQDVAAREAEARKLAHIQAERRETLRNPMIGSAQLRGSLAAVLTTFEADRQRESEAELALQEAETRRREAETELVDARRGLLRARRQTEKRHRIRIPLADALIRAADRRDETEMEENRGFRHRPNSAGE
ncbi:hypothetical protein [Paracoccus alkanivorans]|uniref:Uncharacterized protein n=1 Tax=Paracoccus alkanivorans TaxID=2116655 RepID=A0A3M0MCL2_9RHOB|nr:hypothetical protein [Paracoccus alkanivorans]RMC34943.1 hypothetical protein C9E81_12705 [Paracoccus alkanivorans]